MIRKSTESGNFAFLTVALAALLFASALADQLLPDAAGRVIEAAMILVLLVGVWSIRSNRSGFWTGLGLVFLGIATSAAAWWMDRAGLGPVHVAVLWAFFVLTTWIAARQVLFRGHVDGNSIIGAICIYLLLGLTWGLMYLLVEGLSPESFKGVTSGGWRDQLPDLVYFSFVSLTTMGFGDITPAGPVARFLVYTEGVVGQFYIAIVVASLVGVRISSWHPDNG